MFADGERREALEARFSKLEARVRGERKKWHDTRLPERRAIASEFPAFATAGAVFAFAQWADTASAFPSLTADAIAGAAVVCCPGALLTLTVDGLKPAERPTLAAALRRHRVRFRRIRLESRDEAYPLLRLADAAAGFLRDMREGVQYATELWSQVEGQFTKV